MKLLNILLFFFSSSSAFTKIPPVKNNLICQLSKNNFNVIINKSKNYLELIRYKNVIPTIFLSLTGGFLINPKKIISPAFIVSLINNVLIMANSMVINDIYDIKIDKNNNLDRPLLNGDIKLKEAIIFSSILLGLTKYLSFKFLPLNLQRIINYSLIFINIYTPILKKIPFIKNIFCATLVSFSIFFSALSTNSLIFNKNYYLLLLTMSFIFFGSLHNELLLDMRDYEGDKINNIYTIPVLFGNKISWNIVNNILNISILLNTSFLIYLFNFYYGIVLLFIFSPIKNELYAIKEFNYCKNIIIKSINNTTKPLYFLLFYILILSLI